eukprot:jgi/Orpsp1_1/1183676/evm.model.c7180000086241.1
MENENIINDMNDDINVFSNINNSLKFETNNLNISSNSNLLPIGFDDEDDLININQENEDVEKENKIVSLDKKEKKSIIVDEEEEYFKSYKNMFESQMEPPPIFDEDYLIQNEEEMLQDMLNEEENEYLSSMYENDMMQQKQQLPEEKQQHNNNNNNNNNNNSTLETVNSITSETSIKQKGKRPAMEFEDEDNYLDFSILNNKSQDNINNNPLNALNNDIHSSLSHTQNNFILEHKNKKPQVWNTELGIGFTDVEESSELLEWNSSSNKNLESSILEWDDFTDIKENNINQQQSQQNSLNDILAHSSSSTINDNMNNISSSSSSLNNKKFTERPGAGIVYLTGYSYDNLPLYIPFKPIPTVNEIHHYNKELTTKNMNGQLLDISIYQLMDEIEQEKKEEKELQEAKNVIKQYNKDVVNQEEYMNIWKDDKNKKKEKNQKKEEYEKNLWVNAYTPKRYTDLLGDERINREVLSWVKEWDYCVFQKNDYLKAQNSLNAMKNIDINNNDKYKRPFKKIMLLAGPPGLGKTTLAHVVANHCGYNVVEINA